MGPEERVSGQRGLNGAVRVFDGTAFADRVWHGKMDGCMEIHP